MKRNSDIIENSPVSTRDRMRRSSILQDNRKLIIALKISLSGVLLYYILKKLKK